jgi:ribose 5-phosphate isomerase RpiB
MDTADLEKLIRTVTDEVVKVLSAREGVTAEPGRGGQGSHGARVHNSSSPEAETFDGKLLSEQQVEAFARKGCCRILLRADALVTPLAGDRAQAKGIELIRQEAGFTQTCASRAVSPSRKLALLAPNTSRSERDRVIEAARSCGYSTEMEQPNGRTSEAVREAALSCAYQVANGRFERAVIIDENAFSLASSLAKEAGVRPCICWDVDSAAAARKECDSNLLVLSNRLLGMTMLKRIVTAWLSG